MEEITTVFKENTGSLEKTIQNLSSFSDTLAQFSMSPILNNISDASLQILTLLEKFNSDDNTVGLLLNDNELYQSVNTLSENLSSLIKDIQTNPKRYLQFSAIDLGKDIYINTEGDVASKNTLFKVHLVSTENKLQTDSDLFEGLDNVEMYFASGAYSYLLGSTESYSEIMTIHEIAKKKFPESTIVAFKNGRLIKLEKALKSTRK